MVKTKRMFIIFMNIYIINSIKIGIYSFVVLFFYDHLGANAGVKFPWFIFPRYWAVARKVQGGNCIPYPPFYIVSRLLLKACCSDPHECLLDITLLVLELWSAQCPLQVHISGSNLQRKRKTIKPVSVSFEKVSKHINVWSSGWINQPAIACHWLKSMHS